MSERIESAEIEAAVAQGGTIEIVFASAKDGKQIERLRQPAEIQQWRRKRGGLTPHRLSCHHMRDICHHTDQNDANAQACPVSTSNIQGNRQEVARQKPGAPA